MKNTTDPRIIKGTRIYAGYRPTGGPYYFKAHDSSNGCPLFPDALPIAKALNIPYRLFGSDDEADYKGQIGKIYYVWFVDSHADYVDNFVQNDIVKGILNNKTTNKEMSYMLLKEE